MKEFVLNSEEETLAFGKEIAKHLKIGDVLVLSRRIGFGKNQTDRRNFDVFWFAK